ncbi:MAG: 50S ribosomal protein L9 [Phycisphaeraceae bacterium]|nr:50S ribosomal protein L9 [Phycisphaeraceae bacterium]MCW5753769.1 50S ribosomal protein L9 [Phycisphaeraceae bacterium]
MKKNVRLLLVENVDNLGIIGDVVTVRTGYARNFLLPRGFATSPSEELLAGLAARRAEAQRELAALRKQREDLVKRLVGLEMTVERSCNDQGILYGSVSQHDLAQALTSQGYAVKAREIRLPQVIKRTGDYDLHVKLDNDLHADIRLHVKADRVIHTDARDEMEFDNEGNLIERKPKAEKPAAEAKPDEKAPETADAAAKTDKPRADRPKTDRPRPDKADRPAKKDKPTRASAFEALAVETTKGWGFAGKSDNPAPDAAPTKGGKKGKKG